MSLICAQSVFSLGSVAAVLALTWEDCGVVAPLPSLLFASLTVYFCTQGAEVMATQMSILTAITAFLSVVVCGGISLLDKKKNDEGMPCMACQL